MKAHYLLALALPYTFLLHPAFRSHSHTGFLGKNAPAARAAVFPKTNCAEAAAPEGATMGGTSNFKLQTPNYFPPPWGFFAHKRINRLAALTLPPGMMVLFKPNIDWITEHAVDPDMRRYATKNEAPRHYIDLDVYGEPPFDDLPRGNLDAKAKFTDLRIVDTRGDTVLLFGKNKPVPESLQPAYRDYFFRQVLPRLSGDEATLDVDSLRFFLQQNGLAADVQSAFFEDHLSEHGIVPWHLQTMQRSLTEAFRQRNTRSILKLAAEMGHYVGDAHVPLHTTTNYNGQLTGQHGIHGFWESRIPELFADESYDYFVGKPVYVLDKQEFFWKAVLDSHSMVDSVLTLERAMRIRFPPDRQNCPDMRNGISVVMPCRDFSAAYQTALNDMIERRMRAAIHAVASSWFTAWVDAGSPDLSQMGQPVETEEERKEREELGKNFGGGKIIGRPEEH